ncbi:MAG: CAP domain-containing protein [Candidatus Absconditabacteria bacterium]|nr:CAP domain-containing protein [Candidatus Absconditabacteria bacterium]
MKKLLFGIIIISLISITHADYKTIVTIVLNDIQTTNTNKTDLQKRQNFQNYIPKIQKLTIIDQRVRDALITYLNAKIEQLQTVSKNKGLGKIDNIDQEKIREIRLKLHNDERATKDLTPYTYNIDLEQTATSRAQHLSQLGYSTHERESTDNGYTYYSIRDRFGDQGIIFPAEKNRASNFTENIVYRLNYNCNSSDCTNYLISKIKGEVGTKYGFQFFMSEKTYNGPHYRGIMGTQYTQMGVGIAINPSTKKIFIVTHYSVDF